MSQSWATLSKTPQWQQLIAYYRENPSVFFEQQLKIRTKDPGVPLRPFVQRPMQRKILAYFRHCWKQKKAVYLIVYKARQIGSSTEIQAISFMQAVLFPNVNVLTMAHDTDSTQNIFEMAKIFYENMSPWLRPPRKYGTKRELVFEPSKDLNRPMPGSGSRIDIQTAGNVNSGAAHTIHFAHLSECARYQYAEELKESLLPAIPNRPGCAIVLESTSRGAGSFFHNEWERAVAGDSPYHPIFIAWFHSPDYQIPNITMEKLKPLDAEEAYLIRRWQLTAPQLAWRRHKIDELGDLSLFRQSYPSTPEEGWLVSGDPVFDIKLLLELEATLCHPKWIGDIAEGGRFYEHYENHEEVDGHWCVWEKPQRGTAYDMGVDVALGTEDGDFSCAIILKRNTKEVVAKWHGHIDPFDMSTVSAHAGLWYNLAQIGVEVNGLGFATNARLAETYPNIYRWRYRDEAVPKLTKKTGWDTSPRSKRFLVGLCRSVMRKEKPPLRSRELWDELRAFVTYPGLDTDAYRAAPSHFDDCVIAYLIALVCADDEDERKWGASGILGAAPPDRGEALDRASHDTEWERVLTQGQSRDFMSL